MRSEDLLRKPLGFPFHLAPGAFWGPGPGLCSLEPCLPSPALFTLWKSPSLFRDPRPLGWILDVRGSREAHFWREKVGWFGEAPVGYKSRNYLVSCHPLPILGSLLRLPGPALHHPGVPSWLQPQRPLLLQAELSAIWKVPSHPPEVPILCGPHSPFQGPCLLSSLGPPQSRILSAIWFPPTSQGPLHPSQGPLLSAPSTLQGEPLCSLGTNPQGPPLSSGPPQGYPLPM